MMISENLKLRETSGYLGFYTGFDDCLISNSDRKWVGFYRREEARTMTKM